MDRYIGIDLGTTNSAVAIVENGTPVIIPNDRGQRTTPSVVTFRGARDRVVGSAAKSASRRYEKTTVEAAKRLIGRRWNDPDLQDTISRLPFDVVEDPDSDGVMLSLPGIDDFLPQDISAIVLGALKEDAERYLNGPVTHAVITVPAYFNDAQRDATKKAGEIAGLNVVAILNEPTAAALAYGLKSKQWHKVAVYDFGGGTFDISILEVRTDAIEVLATAGDTWLGGRDMDDAVIDWLAEAFEDEHGIDLLTDEKALVRLRAEAEKARIELSSVLDALIELEGIAVDLEGRAIALETNITRADLEDLVEELIERTEEPIRKALSDAKLKPTDIDTVVLVGGTTRMPAVRRKVEEIFGRRPNHTINPDEAVALGAALRAESLAGGEAGPLLRDVTALTLSVGVVNDGVEQMIMRNTKVPKSVEKSFTTVSDYQESIIFDIRQGESTRASENDLIGSFVLDGIQRAKKHVPTVMVKFELDMNGILKVRARDQRTNASMDYRIENTALMSAEQLEDAKDRYRRHEPLR